MGIGDGVLYREIFHQLKCPTGALKVETKENKSLQVVSNEKVGGPGVCQSVPIWL
jgi:hypothetical protein